MEDGVLNAVADRSPGLTSLTSVTGVPTACGDESGNSSSSFHIAANDSITCDDELRASTDDTKTLPVCETTTQPLHNDDIKITGDVISQKGEVIDNVVSLESTARVCNKEVIAAPDDQQTMQVEDEEMDVEESYKQSSEPLLQASVVSSATPIAQDGEQFINDRSTSNPPPHSTTVLPHLREGELETSKIEADPSLEPLKRDGLSPPYLPGPETTALPIDESESSKIEADPSLEPLKRGDLSPPSLPGPETTALPINESESSKIESDPSLELLKQDAQDVTNPSLIFPNPDETSPSLEPLKQDETAHSLEPLKQDETTPSLEPLKQDETTPSLEPLKQDETTPSLEPLKQDETTPSLEPLKQDETTPSLEPLKQDETTPSLEPLKQDETTPSLEPLKQTNRTVSPLPMLLESDTTSSTFQNNPLPLPTPHEVLEGGEGGEHTPSVSSSGYGGSRETSPEEGEMITEDMRAEEERLRERDSRERSLEGEAGELSHMKEYQRYLRLQHLLEKSSIYSKFLLERMENQMEEKKKSSGRAKKKGSTEKKPEEVKATPSTRRSTRNKKRKADESIELSLFMDKKGKLKQMKLDKGGGVAEAVETTTDKKTEEKPQEQERYFKGKVVPQAQPALMTGGVMRPYQIKGMEWIKVLYENGVNGILADEMGLGKTLQVIGVIAHLIEMGVRGPFLVAAPLSTLPNWVSEFKKFTPEIPVILYHGTQLEREKMRRKIFRQKRKKGEVDAMPVVVTSYEICMRDQRHLMYRNWRFLVVDEGHRIKNLNCKLIRCLKSYDAANRLLLTGTPLQNNLAELWSLLNFILPDIFDDLNGFQSWFDFDVNGEDNREKIIAQEREQHVLSTLHQILTPFLLRRLKTDVEFSLPPKKEVLVYAPMTTVQQKYYTSLLDRTILQMVKGKGKACCEETDRGAESGRQRTRTSCSGYSQLSDEQFESLLAGDKSYDDLVTRSDQTEHKQPVVKLSATNIKMTNVWMMLRKCCNHPYLLEFPMTSDGQFRVDEDLVTCCGKLMLFDRLLLALISRGHKTIVFSQFTSMLDILEDYLELRGISYGRLDGQMPFAERQRQMAVFQGDPDCRVFLTSTRAGGLGINLTAADTVIIYDSDWNPQADLQAQDRCHRIGQTKPVMVYRLVTANTFDQRIVERATSKRRLEKMVIHKGKFKGYSGEEQQLSLEDLTSLLHSVDHESVVDSRDAIISDEALAALLDRSVRPARRGEGEGEGGMGVGEHEGVFKVIDEQGSSGNSLLSINNTKPSTSISPQSQFSNASDDTGSKGGTTCTPASDHNITTTQQTIRSL